MSKAPQTTQRITRRRARQKAQRRVQRKAQGTAQQDARVREWLIECDARDAAIIRRYGWLVQCVGGGPCSVPGCECSSDGPSFAYTVGLFGFNHPELLIFGLPAGIATDVLNLLGDRVKAGETLMPDQLLTLPVGHRRIVLQPVPNPGDIVFAANRYYGRPPFLSVPVLQVTHDDDEGRFPWEPGYAGPEQPRPGTFRA